ncbi:MAG: ribulose-phosphate 3-epimerase [Candidatus Brockarchaeota archaeon]|nr:ribulose-phosphate 3-epimerase [Candidatus Brockarchaeota archaeon]
MFLRVKIAASILSADFARLAEGVKQAESAGVDMLHIDVMDAHFVPNMTIGPPVVRCIRKETRLPLEAHLMVDKPEWFINEMAKVGVDIITIHVESTRRPLSLIRRIRELGVKPGVSLNPATEVGKITRLLDSVSIVLVMTVNPGFGAQRFMPETLPKITAVRRSLFSKGLSNVDVAVDGGVNVDTAPLAVKAGATILVAGSAIYGSNNVAKAVKGLRKSVEGVRWEP